MQIKKPLRITTAFDFVCEAVKFHFKEKLPPNWEGLVALACSPMRAAEQADLLGYEPDAKTGKQVKFLRKVDVFETELRAFKENWARDADLTLQILCFARQVVMKPKKTDKDKVLSFLMSNSAIIRDDKVLTVDDSAVKDEELALLIFGRGARKKANVVKKVRRSLS
jgi:hypothetical protein